MVLPITICCSPPGIRESVPYLRQVSGPRWPWDRLEGGGGDRLCATVTSILFIIIKGALCVTESSEGLLKEEHQRQLLFAGLGC